MNIFVGVGFFLSGFVVDDVDWWYLFLWSFCMFCGVCLVYFCCFLFEMEVLIRYI